jgi:hypothetical protein
MGTGDEKEARRSKAFVTARLQVRPRAAADDLVLNALAANPAIAPNLCATMDGASALAIVERHSGRLLGGANYGGTGLGSGVEISVWIGEPEWGQGYGTEAGHALIDHVFSSDPRTGILWSSNRVTNGRARRVIEKCGFQFRGSGMVRVSGRGAFPIERFALDRATWQSLKAWGGIVAAEATPPPQETAA